jgi:hypothetical protein
MIFGRVLGGESATCPIPKYGAWLMPSWQRPFTLVNTNHFGKLCCEGAPLKKVIVATYASVNMANQVVQRLVTSGFARGDIGLAISEHAPASPSDDGTHPAGALVTVTASGSQIEHATEILNQYEPLELDQREFQWRRDPGMTPDEDE